RVILSYVFTFIIFNLIKYIFKSVPNEIERYMREAIDHGDKRGIEEARYYVNNFRKQFNSVMMVKLIIYFIFVIAIFFICWYYTTVFCAVYQTARKGWGYGAVNAIILDWVGFSFVIALVLTALKRCFCSS